MHILEVSGLWKTYPAFQLQDISFSLEPGRITGFIGRNGAGKTTTLKSILGLLHPDKGDIRFFDGIPLVGAEREIKQDIGYVSGGISYYPTKKIRTITDVTRRFYRNWDDRVYQDCLNRFQLDEHKTPAQLSEGMKVKYALALALSHHAKLLILDEPTSGLDPVSREELLDIFLDLQDQGTTIFFSTHITSDLDKCADDILYIRNGRILAQTNLKTFVASYCAVTLTKEEQATADPTRLIGRKRSKEGFTAIATVENSKHLPGIILPADLDTIMVHMEKEESL